jgi:hypothetical protein
MRYGLTVLMLIINGIFALGQTAGTIEGSVSYVTTQNVYVKFNSTAGISAGDTLFVRKTGALVPVLIVKDLSSISCVCTPLAGMMLKVQDQVIYRPLPKAGSAREEIVPVPPPVQQETAGQPMVNEIPDSAKVTQAKGPGRIQSIHGYINAASYSNWSGNTATNSQREKFTFSLLAKNLGNTGLSAECYLSYYVNNNQWNEIQNSVFNGLKVYNFNVKYDFGDRGTILVGRKINPKLSNMGANDGVQGELRFRPITIGLIAGFRPNFTDYGFNANLFQFGTYLFNEYAGKKGFMQTTLAFINQTNNWKLDRRFFYLQHVNSLVKNLTFFGSVEVDIYGKEFNAPDSSYTNVYTPKLTNLYLSLNYRLMNKLSLAFSYSARHNIIYYETYKNYLDRLLDPQTLQGYSLSVNYSPVNRLSLGATAAYRFEKEDPSPTKNLYVYASYSQIPGINASTTVSFVILHTGYIDGKIYSAGLSKDLAKGKLYLGATYRYVDYNYYSTEYAPTLQNMGEVSLTWRIIAKLSLSVYYEGTFEKSMNYNRIYAQVNFRF